MSHQNQIQDELMEITRRMKEQEHLFDIVDDDDLIDAIIYEQRALSSRYTYLIKKAKEENEKAKARELKSEEVKS